MELTPFAGAAVSSRDWALAYAIVAGRDPTQAAQARAFELLSAAERNSPNDVEVLLYLAELDRNSGREELAVPLYRRAMQLDPLQVTASVGLGGILFERGQYAEAIPLWRDALSRNAGLVLVATNLAMAQWRGGDLQSAGDTLRRVIDLSPGFRPARNLLKDLQDALAKQ
jgi:tetratricopeptide (TPR) repeat protein